MSSSQSESPSRSQRSTVTFQLWILNIAVSALISCSYLRHAPPADSLRTWIATWFGLALAAMTYSLAPGILLLGCSWLLRGARPLAALHACIWSMVQVALFADTVLYGIFRYHFNAMVWNVITTSGGGESVHVGWIEYAQTLGGGALFGLAVYKLHGRLRATTRTRVLEGRQLPRVLRPRWITLGLLLPIALVQLGIYAHADLYRDRRVIALSRLYLVYPRLTIKRVARDYLGVDLRQLPRVEFAEQGVLLNYPRAYPAMREDGDRPNILIIVIDCLRADMLDPETMPRISALKSQARVFEDHLSGGNATRFGLFSMIYGLHGTYWLPIYGEQRSPVLIDTLMDLGYDFKILSSPSMTYPELRSTAWVRIEEDVEDRLGEGQGGDRDEALALAFERFLDERDAQIPFFTFAFLDATHSYSFPAEHTTFRPYGERVEYMKLAQGMTPAEVLPIFNRYRNAVHYDDSIAGRMLDALAATGQLENTLILVTGDHGEEFFDHGHFGHTSNFARAQVQVPLLLMGPGIPNGVELGPTSHLDIPATLLELLGADPSQRSDWTLGQNLLAPQPERRRTIADWHSLGLWVPGGILSLPMASYGAHIETYDMDWKPIHEDGAILEAEGPTLLELALECRRFLR